MARSKRPAVPARRTTGTAQCRRVDGAGGSSSGFPAPRAGDILSRATAWVPTSAGPASPASYADAVRGRWGGSPPVASEGANFNPSGTAMSQVAPAVAVTPPVPSEGASPIPPGTAVSHAGRADAVTPLVPLGRSNVDTRSTAQAREEVALVPRPCSGVAHGGTSRVVGEPEARSGMTTPPRAASRRGGVIGSASPSSSPSSIRRAGGAARPLIVRPMLPDTSTPSPSVGVNGTRPPASPGSSRATLLPSAVQRPSLRATTLADALTASLRPLQLKLMAIFNKR